ncbi:MAG: hypothetical protein SGPRY_011990 [Prymnesium sp.]
MASPENHFDYLVIGGGSGGVASARRAAAHGARVGVVERERLGGTCVNVGCVPKKVMFNTGSLMQVLHQAGGYGFEIGDIKFTWAEIKRRRDAYVKRLNGIYENNLNNAGITFITGDAKFTGPKEVEVGGVSYSGENVLIAVGGKPAAPDIPGAELAMDSNGFFELEELPAKVVVVGSGYIAVELAGILQILGSEVELLIRGDRPLRTMEKMVTEQLVTEMQEEGVKFVKGEMASIVEEDGKKTITLKSGEVLLAIGRTPVTDSLNLGAAGIETTQAGHICVDKVYTLAPKPLELVACPPHIDPVQASRTTADGVYAVGDVIDWPNARAHDLSLSLSLMRAAWLSSGLFNGLPEEESIMDYEMVPTVVFSHPPLAIARTLQVMGLTEEQAIERYGADAVTVHKTTFVNMFYVREVLAEGQYQPKTMAKLVCVGPEQRVIGVHMIGLAVDEILQGFSVAIKMGATKAAFDSVVAIHPTSAEELVTIPPWQAKYKELPVP